MNFADLRFWGYLILALALVLLVRLPFRALLSDRLGQYDRVSLGLIGIFLLGCVSLQTLAIFLTVSLVTFFGLRLILCLCDEPSNHRKFLWVLIPLQISPLLWFKYADFLGNGVLGLEQSFLVQLMIPIGISFYTFQLVSFAIDTLVYRHPLPGVIDSLNFAGFFPQIVAGPIERREKLLPQLQNFRFRWETQQVEAGVSWIILGLFLKRCLADNLAVNVIGHSGTNVFLVWLETIFFGFQIYFDFAGYSLMALGVATCLGIKLTLNFRSPYCATNIGDFWRRWHITLSTWFRDYVYLPLGGARTRFWAFNIVAVFVVSGIWHGAGWNFVFWGLLHGIFLIIYRLTKRIHIPAMLAYLITHLGVFVAWLCFYETDTSELVRKLTLLLNPFSYGVASFKGFLGAAFNVVGLTAFVTMAMVAVVIAMEFISLRKNGEPYSVLRKKGLSFVLIFLTVFLAPTEKNEFIYFVF